MKIHISSKSAGSPQIVILAVVLIFLISAACSATNAIQRVFGSGGGIGKSVEIVEAELSTEDCFTSGDQFDEYWDQEILPDLISDRRNCSSGDVSVLKNCLKSQVLQGGKCIAEAQAACQVEFEAIPLNFPQGTARLPLTVAHSDAEEKIAFMDIQGYGDYAEGMISYILKDAHLCTIEVEANFQAVFNDSTCSLEGTAMLEMIYEGAACASVCSSGPNSIPCPVTRSGEVPIQATLDNGKLLGGIGGEDCDPGCIGFSAEP